MRRFHLIAPVPQTDTYFTGVAGQGLSVSRVAPIAIVTVAAFAPEGVEVTILDEALGPVDFEADAEVIGITANISQARRAIEIAREFRRRGRTVVVGGPHVSLDPATFKDCADVLVMGEFEDIAAQFYADLLAGALKPEYRGGKPDLRSSPAPRWDLYDNDRALVGLVQTSRGCPFECNYCDVIQYLGRKQRHKEPDQVMAEIQRLYDLGYNRLALADDNFTVYRKRAYALLEAMGAWNGREGRDFVTFATQASIDIARDQAMLRACAEAGLLNIFIGLETPNEESLAAASKRQNLHVDLAVQVETIVRAGIRVEGSLMVGFDQDGPDIFRRQYEFAQSLPIGPFLISSLVAPVSTPLHDEMSRAGRLSGDDPLGHFPVADLISNIIPAQMTRGELYVGARWLISRIYHPEAFVQRLERVADLIAPNPLLARGGRPYDPPQRAYVDKVMSGMMRKLVREDREVAKAVSHTFALMRVRPDIRDSLADVMMTWLLSLYMNRVRKAYDVEWARMDEPPLDLAPALPTPMSPAA